MKWKHLIGFLLKKKYFSVFPILSPKLHFNIGFIGQVKLLLILTEIIPLKPSALFIIKSFFLEQTAEFKEIVTIRINFACVKNNQTRKVNLLIFICLF